MVEEPTETMQAVMIGNSEEEDKTATSASDDNSDAEELSGDSGHQNDASAGSDEGDEANVEPSADDKEVEDQSKKALYDYKANEGRFSEEYAYQNSRKKRIS